MKRYVLVVRDTIYSSTIKTDEMLKEFGCYYQSPVFLADGTDASFDKAMDYFYSKFSHFFNWRAEIVAM